MNRTVRRRAINRDRGSVPVARTGEDRVAIGVYIAPVCDETMELVTVAELLRFSSGERLLLTVPSYSYLAVEWSALKRAGMLAWSNKKL